MKRTGKQNTSHNRLVGIGGENAAAAYLESKGYEILERNWRSGHKEIDIIAKWRDMVVIVEVKTRMNASFIDPVASIGLKKQATLVRAAESYLFMKRLDSGVRFDIMVVEAGRHGHVIEHIIDAFHPLAGC